MIEWGGEIFITDEMNEENKLTAIEGQWGRTQRQSKLK